MGDRKQPNPPPVQNVVKPDPPPPPPPRRGYEDGYAFRLGQAIGHLQILLDAVEQGQTPPLTLRDAIQRAREFIAVERSRI